MSLEKDWSWGDSFIVQNRIKRAATLRALAEMLVVRRQQLTAEQQRAHPNASRVNALQQIVFHIQGTLNRVR